MRITVHNDQSREGDIFLEIDWFILIWFVYGGHLHFFYHQSTIQKEQLVTHH